MNEQTSSAGLKPTHRLYRVIGEGEKTVWTPIGSAWANKDGKGFNISCEAIPLRGRIVMRAIKPQDANSPSML